MKLASLRLKIALSAGALAAAVVFVFAAVSAWWFYHEQLDMASREGSRALGEAQLRQAWSETSELAASYLAALPLVAILSAVGAWWMAGRISRPLARLSNEASKIDARSLDARLPDPRSGDEISALAQTLNHLLDRLERSFRQSSRFSADASHELRTPLAIMRGQIEHAIRDHPTGEQTGILVELLEENQRLSAIVDKLLLLARADAGQLLPGRVPVDLSALLEEAAADFGIIAESRGLDFRGQVSAGIWTDGDVGLLRQLAFNLFDNALKYNVPAGSVCYRLEASGGKAEFAVANSGPGIPQNARSRLFERFFRLDEARNREVGGSGLGLNLCREIAAAHGGRIFLSTAAADENEFVVELPLARMD